MEEVRPLRILLLEDSAFDAELLRVALESAHAAPETTWVKDEAAFLSALETARFDVILSDYQLPGFSGADALAHAIRLAPETPFIFVSGVIGEENAVELLKSGATDYVTKGRLSRLPLVVDRALREVRERAAKLAAESQLREADALYARVVDSLQDHAVVLLDRDGRVRQWNRAAGRVFGHSLEAIRGRSAELLFMPADRHADVLAELLRRALADGVSRDDRWLMRADGTTLRAEGVVTPLVGGNGQHTGFSGLFRDVTERHRAAEALRRAKDEAERTNEMKDQFLAVLSHELRAPLSSITGWADILARRDSGDPVLAKAATVIRRNARLQARMIDDLLDMSAVVAGKLLLNEAPTDIADLAREIVLSQLHSAQSKGVALNGRHAEPVWVRGDAHRLSQVITNLVGNALKFTDAGGRVDVETFVQGGCAVLRVTDTGRGISPDFLPFVFDRLRQEDGSSTRLAGGLGLGLAIARALVELHGGRIEARSGGAQQGASFVVTLPRLEPSPGEARPAAAPSSSEPIELRAARILLVDDEPDAREVGQVALTSLGAQVRLAANAGEALALLRSEKFDVLVSDIGMPGVDGLSLIRDVRRLPGCGEGELAAVALTAFARLSDRQAGIEAGFQSYVAKPIALRSLSDAIRHAQAISRAAVAR